MIDSIVKRKYEEVSQWVKPNSKILDIGCDDGSLRNYVKPAYYAGVDIEKKNIDNLKKQGHKAFLIDLNNYKKLPFKEKYDYILFLDVLEHTLNPAKVINDFKKLLRKDGRIIISLPNDYHIGNKIRFLLNRKITKLPFWEHGHLHTFPIKEGKKFLEEQGLKCLEVKYLAPEKPKSIPPYIRKLLAKIFPNNFARVVIYSFAIS